MTKMTNNATVSRRRLLARGAALGGVAAVPSLLPAWAHSGPATDLSGLKALSGTTFDLTVAAAKPAIDGKTGRAILINDQLPAPLLRWREGDDITLRVTNRLRVDTSIHWHGILLPFHMDGVPGVSFPGIRPGETFTYRFPLVQAGTYWYHSHSGLQEQLGHYGPIVIEPRDADPVTFDREYVIVLSDWTFEDPHRVFAKLKKMSDNYNYQQRTLRDFIADAKAQGFDRAVADRQMWGAMRMNPTDIADVTGATYTYLINGHGPADNWTGLFTPGERVRLRCINASSMSIFNVRIPGLPMQVVQADGLNVVPVETDEFQIGVAETFDVVVQPNDDRAYTLMAESNDRSGFARATLTSQMGLTAAVPPLRPRPTLTMKDMAMDHGEMGHGEMDHSEMDHGGTAAPDHAAMGHDGDHASMKAPEPMDHAAMGHTARSADATAKTDANHAAMGHGSGHSDKKSSAAMDHAAMGHGDKHTGKKTADTMDHAAMGHTAKTASAKSAVDHAAMGHGNKHAGKKTADAVDHAAMGHTAKTASAKSAVDHAAMGHGEKHAGKKTAGAMDHAAMGHTDMDHGDQKRASMDHAAMGHGNQPDTSDAAVAQQEHNHPTGPGVVGLAMNPVNRLGERPAGLTDEPHRVLVYADLKALAPNPDTRAPERTLELHLTSNMERYMWSFDGVKYSDADGPIKFYKGERLRLTLVNDTMMPHPIHLHGMFFDVVTAEHAHKPRKHTIVVKPGEKMSVDITAEAVGDWSFHCHLLYHMHAGMMRVVSVVDDTAPA